MSIYYLVSAMLYQTPQAIFDNYISKLDTKRTLGDTEESHYSLAFVTLCDLIFEYTDKLSAQRGGYSYDASTYEALFHKLAQLFNGFTQNDYALTKNDMADYYRRKVIPYPQDNDDMPAEIPRDYLNEIYVRSLVSLQLKTEGFFSNKTPTQIKSGKLNLDMGAIK